MHIFNPYAGGYAFPDSKFIAWLYGAGSLVGLMGEYRFTQAGFDALNLWMGALGDIELTDDRRGYLQREHRTVMEGLVASGDAWQERNSEFRITCKWWETTMPQPG